MAVNLVIGLNFLLFIGVNAARVVISLYALELGASPSAIGGIIAMLYIFPLLLSWPIGVLSDRFGGRWLLVIGAAGGALGMLVAALYPGLPALYVAAAMTGLTIAFAGVICQNLVGVLSKPQERTRNFSNYATIGSLCNFFGPLFAGLVIDQAGFSVACVGVAAQSLLAIAILALWGGVLPPARRRTLQKSNLLRTLADRRLWGMLAVSSLSTLGNDLYQAFFPIYAHGLGLSASAIGGMLAAMAIGSFGARLLMPRLIAQAGEARLLAGAFCLAGAAFLLLPLTGGSALLTAISVVFGISLGCSQPLTMMLMFSQAAEGRSGETVGLRMTVCNVARIAGPALFGALGSALGLIAVFWICAVLMGSGGWISRPGNTSR